MDCAVPLDLGHLTGVFDLACDRARKVLIKSKNLPDRRTVHLPSQMIKSKSFPLLSATDATRETLLPQESCLDLSKKNARKVWRTDGYIHFCQDTPKV
jgi:hypothetical protein